MRRTTVHAVRALLTLAVLGFFCLEGLYWCRSWLYDLQFEVYPKVGITETGAIARWKARPERAVWSREILVYGTDGSPGEWVADPMFWRDHDEKRARSDLAVQILEARSEDESRECLIPFERLAFHDVVLAGHPGSAFSRSPAGRIQERLPPYMFADLLAPPRDVPWQQRVLRLLRWHDYVVVIRSIPEGANGREQRARLAAIAGLPRWAYRGGRFLRLGQNGDVIGGFGPDGVVEGPSAEQGESFDGWELIQTAELRGAGWRRFWLQLVHGETRRLAVLQGGSFPWDPPVDAPRFEIVLLGPGRLRSPFWPKTKVETIVIEGPDGQRLRPVSTAVGHRRNNPCVLRLGGQLVLIAGLQELGRSSLAAAGEDLRGIGRPQRRKGYTLRVDGFDNDKPLYRRSRLGLTSRFTLGVVSYPGPIRAIGAHIKFRLYKKGEPVVENEVVLKPTTTGEYGMAAALGLVAAARPPLLSVVSFATEAPHTVDGFFSWWWRDPLFGGAANVAWFLFTVGIALACAVWARRQARLRCASPGQVLFWTAVGALLGPMGIVWMWTVVPMSSVVERCSQCRRDRAVHLDACPGCGSAWPEPEPTGVEVFV